MYNTFTVDNGAMGRAKTYQYVQEETKRVNPCGGCRLIEVCAKNGTDCFAFRRWTHDGNYKDKQIGRLLRPFEQV